MSYQNADILLPPELLEEIQRYVQGSLVYIPRARKARMGWGRKNGTRQMIDSRNAAIRAAKDAGRSVDEIADSYALSPDSIRKILYSRREGLSS